MNITAYYPDLIPENELYVLLGKVPKEVWYFVDIIELEDIPGVGDDDSEVSDHLLSLLTSVSL